MIMYSGEQPEVNCPLVSQVSVQIGHETFIHTAMSLFINVNLLQHNAELAVREMLREIARQTMSRTGSTILHAEDYMDNGVPIKLSVDIDPIKVGTIVFLILCN